MTGPGSVAGQKASTNLGAIHLGWLRYSGPMDQAGYLSQSWNEGVERIAYAVDDMTEQVKWLTDGQIRSLRAPAGATNRAAGWNQLMWGLFFLSARRFGDS